jgi:hypothetical protein
MSRRMTILLAAIATLVVACTSATAPNTTAHDCGGGTTVGSGDRHC